MSPNVEMKLLSTMLGTGNFDPITHEEIDNVHFSTSEGLAIYEFVKSYKFQTGGEVRWPSLSVVSSRFADSPFDLPSPEEEHAIPSLVNELRSRNLRQQMLHISQTLAEAAEDPTSHPLNTLDETIQLARKLSMKGSTVRRSSMRDDFSDVLVQYDSGAILQDGIPWPWPLLNKATRGMQRQEFVVIAGRPKARKTFIMLVIAAYAVRTYGARILFVSPEMPTKQILLRFIAILAVLPYSEFKNSAMDEESLMQLLDAAEQFGKLLNENDEEYELKLQNMFPDMAEGAIPCFEVIQGTGRSVAWVEAQCERYRPDMILVDSFYRLQTDTKTDGSEWRAVTQISRALKDMAMDTNTVVLATHQLNRDAENKVGGLGNLALADAVGQDADLIMRVITAKMQGRDQSALVFLGAREVPYDGILIRNEPCTNFDELGEIRGRKVLTDMLAAADIAEAEERAKDEVDARDEAEHKSTKKKPARQAWKGALDKAAAGSSS